MKMVQKVFLTVHTHTHTLVKVYAEAHVWYSGLTSALDTCSCKRTPWGALMAEVVGIC